MIATYLAFDCETGGLDPTKTSLLTAYLMVLDSKFFPIDAREIAVKHPVYQVEPRAMEVNGINLIEHDKTAKAIPAVKDDLLFLLEKHGKLVPLGHNVDFDISFVSQVLPDFRNRISHRKLDTAVIGRFLKLTGKLPPELEGFPDYLKHFNITVDGKLHNAKSDTHATVNLLEAMIALGAK